MDKGETALSRRNLRLTLHGPFQILLAESADPRTPARMLAVFN